MPSVPNQQAYNLPQTVFMLSLGSNALFNKVGLQPELQHAINLFLRGYDPDWHILHPFDKKGPPPSPFFQALNAPSPFYPSLAGGDWSTVWGPVVYCASDGWVQINAGATNMMYVAYSPSQQTYVVAIAGTNPTGWTAGTVEDLDVGPGNMQVWPPSVVGNALSWTTSVTPPNTAAIDAGTSVGLSVLYEMVCPYTNQTLVEFLNPANFPNNGQSSQTIVFTGHSLGGALSPSLAMLLYPTAGGTYPATPGAPNPYGGNWQNVYIIATAGPTPGNALFAQNFYSPVAPTVVNPSIAPVPAAWPPAAITASVSGPYAPVLTDVLLPATKTPPVSGAWPFMYWNVNYANVYDVVPRAWTLLANLVEPTIGSSAAAGYPSFFADGAILEEGGGNTVGSYAYGLVTNLMAKSGYGAGKTTPYYAQCLIHFPINGTWGNWQKNENYPQGFTPSTPPQSFDTFLDLVPWILDAHLDQYSQALLGYPCLGIDQQVSTG